MQRFCQQVRGLPSSRRVPPQQQQVCAPARRQRPVAGRCLVRPGRPPRWRRDRGGPYVPARRARPPRPQCGRFHPLAAFDADQRSCREELARHAARRRELRRRKKGLAPGAHSGGGPPLMHGRHRDREGPYRRVMMTGRPGMPSPAAASPWASASGGVQVHALAPGPGPQQMPLQMSAPVPALPPWNASDAQSLLLQLSSLQNPHASSAMLSTSTAAQLAELPALAALSAALTGGASLSGLPALQASLQASLPHGLQASLGLAAPSSGRLGSTEAGSSGEQPLLAPAGGGGPSVEGLLQQHLPTIQSLPAGSQAQPQQGQQPAQLSAPLPAAASGRAQAGGGAAAATGPVCQVCRSSLADLLPFYKVRLFQGGWGGCGESDALAAPCRACTCAARRWPRLAAPATNPRTPPAPRPALQRYRVCAEHMAAREVLRDGVPQRFCQQ